MKQKRREETRGVKNREVLVCSDDPFDDGVPDLVINHPVVSTADEELVLMESREKKERTSIHSHSRYSNINIYIDYNIFQNRLTD